MNGAARLLGRPVQVQLPADSRADVSAHGFWKREATAMFYIRISNLDVGSYLHMMQEKSLAKVKKENKDL